MTQQTDEMRSLENIVDSLKNLPGVSRGQIPFTMGLVERHQAKYHPPKDELWEKWKAYDNMDGSYLRFKSHFKDCLKDPKDKVIALDEVIESYKNHYKKHIEDYKNNNKKHCETKFTSRHIVTYLEEIIAKYIGEATK